MDRMPNDNHLPGWISTRLVSPTADCAASSRLNDYDSFAGAYSASNENNLLNAYYERPAMLALAGDVAGRRILDAGCGSGPLFAALRDRGAVVTGIDKSAGLLELARRRLGAEADLQVAELGRPLSFPDVTAVPLHGGVPLPACGRVVRIALDPAQVGRCARRRGQDRHCGGGGEHDHGDDGADA